MFVQSEKLESEHLLTFLGKTEHFNKRAKEGYDVTPKLLQNPILQKEEEIHYRAPIMIQMSEVIPSFNVIEDFFMPLLEERVLSHIWIQFGFNASVNERQEKNKAYYHFTQAQQPNKTVVNEMMRRCVEAAELKEMPFIQLVGDQQGYAIILELKNENPEKYKNILPVMGGFHVQGTFMSTINKRFKVSGIFQLVHGSDLLEEGSTDQALRGAHHNRGIRCYMLLYEALSRLLLQTTYIAIIDMRLIWRDAMPSKSEREE